VYVLRALSSAHTLRLGVVLRVRALGTALLCPELGLQSRVMFMIGADHEFAPASAPAVPPRSPAVASAISERAVPGVPRDFARDVAAVGTVANCRAAVSISMSRSDCRRRLRCWCSSVTCKKKDKKKETKKMLQY
jgi:hypothetical protein